MTAAVDVSLPPDQSLRISILEKKCLILSVSDFGLVVGDGTPYTDFSSFDNGVYIFAEGLGFTSKIVSRHGLSISADSLTSLSTVHIITTGKRGADQASIADTAQSGEPAGPLNVYVQRGTDDNALNFLYVADGGNGGDTIVSGGKGGNGAPGGNIVRAFNSWYSTLFSAFASFLARDDVVSGDSNLPVRNTDAVYIAALDLSKSSTNGMSSIMSAMKTFRQTVSSIGRGETVTLHKLTIDARRVRNVLVEAIDNQKRKSFTAASVQGGYPGSGKGAVGKTGDYGEQGTDSSLLLPLHDSQYLPLDNAAALRKSTFAFAHPDHCAMLLTRANVFYYMGSPILKQQATQLYRRIIDRLSFLPLSPDDPLYKAYWDSPVMPRDSLARLSQISTGASQQLVHIASGIDYNGYTTTYAPRTSYLVYHDALNDAINDFAAFENAYIAYYAALSEQEKLQDAVSYALRQIDALLGSLKHDINDLIGILQERDSDIRLLSQPVLDTYNALINEYEKVKERIKDNFGLSVPQIVNALTSLAFAPNKAMIGVQIANLLWEGFNQVPNVYGTGINKGVLIGKLTEGEASVKGIKNTLSRDRLDGSFKLDDPFGTRLLVLEDGMMGFLSEYANSAFADVIQEMKAKWDAYIKAVIARNGKVLDYNAALKLIVQKAEDRKKYTKKRDELQGRIIEEDDPRLPDITAYMGEIYQSSRERVMKLLNLLVRSLNFRMLEENDIYEIAFQSGGVDTVPHTVTSNVLRGARSRIEDKFSQSVERWGSEPAKFPADFSSATGKRIKLKSFELTTLKSDVHKVDVTIPTVFRNTKPINDFSGCCNVRVYKVRFVLDGLKLKKLVKSGRVSVHMTHNGMDNFVDKKNLEHVYTHDPVKVVYSFNLHQDGTMDVLDDGNIANADVNNTATSYAAPGPFTTWTVDLTNSEISHLDFSDVKAAYFDFCGTNYAL